VAEACCARRDVLVTTPCSCIQGCHRVHVVGGHRRRDGGGWRGCSMIRISPRALSLKVALPDRWAWVRSLMWSWNALGSPRSWSWLPFGKGHRIHSRMSAQRRNSILVSAHGEVRDAGRTDGLAVPKWRAIAASSQTDPRAPFEQRGPRAQSIARAISKNKNRPTDHEGGRGSELPPEERKYSPGVSWPVDLFCVNRSTHTEQVVAEQEGGTFPTAGQHLSRRWGLGDMPRVAEGR